MRLGAAFHNLSLILCLLALAPIVATSNVYAEDCESRLLKDSPQRPSGQFAGFSPNAKLIVVLVSKPQFVRGRTFHGPYRFVEGPQGLLDLDGFSGKPGFHRSFLDMLQNARLCPVLDCMLMRRTLVTVTDVKTFLADPTPTLLNARPGKLFVWDLFKKMTNWHTMPFFPAGPDSILTREGNRGKRVDKRLRQMVDRYSFELVPIASETATPEELRIIFEALVKQVTDELMSLKSQDSSDRTDSNYVLDQLNQSITSAWSRKVRERLEPLDASRPIPIVHPTTMKELDLLRELQSLIRARLQEGRVALRVNNLLAMNIRLDEAIERGLLPKDLENVPRHLRRRELDVVTADGIYEVKTWFPSRVNEEMIVKPEKVNPKIRTEQLQDKAQIAIADAVESAIASPPSDSSDEKEESVQIAGRTSRKFSRYKVFADGKFLFEGDPIPPNSFGAVTADGTFVQGPSR